MGVLQNILVRARSFVYDRSQRFIEAEDARRNEGLSERFNNNFIKFYNGHNLDGRGYNGYDDFDAVMLFKVYDKYGEKGLDLVGFNNGVKLDFGDISNLLYFVERCELIENSDKGLDRGINLALRFVDEFSLNEIVNKIRDFKEPYLVYTLNLQYKLEEIERQRGQQESIVEPEEDYIEEELIDEFEDEHNLDDAESKFQVSSVDDLIAGATLRSKETDSGKGMSFDKNIEID